MLSLLVASVVLQLPVSPPAPIRYQAGILTPPLVGTPGAAALRYAASIRAELGLPAGATLTEGPKFSTRFGGTVHLVERVNGLEVQGGRVIVTFDTSMRVVRVSAAVKTWDRAVTTPVLSGEQALVIASHEVDGALLKADHTPYGGWRAMAFAVGDEVHAGYLTFVPTLKASERWHVAVDGVTGQVLRVENRVHAASFDASVYPSSPGNAGITVNAPSTATLEGLPADGGYLQGERLRALNCCPTVGCDADAGAKRAVGTLQSFGGAVNYDMAICDQVNRATNDPALHASGDYVYAPVDPPTTPTPSLNSPADYDEFAEVHAYFHANKAWDALEQLSLGQAADAGFSPFALRNVGTDKPAVWVNASDPDFQSATQNGQGVYVSNVMARTDNAMFAALENMDFLSVPELALASDALVIYQGDKADFAYDGPVLWHEFGHGAIHSTANWDTVVSWDTRSANNESSALHEGVADVLAIMTGNDPVVGAYVGPRIDPLTTEIRDAANSFTCPDVLWGESHQDSMHFVGAVWQMREAFFQGMDQGNTFDAAFYAAMVSFPPDVNFEKAARIIEAQVKLAFPAMADAEAKADQVFVQRGVLGCSKVLDLTTNNQPRYYYAIPGQSFAEVAQGQDVPGPFQFKFRVPNGASSVTMTAAYPAFGANPTARVALLAKANAPITFTKSGVTVTHDEDVRVVPTIANQVATGTAVLDVPCGGEVYFAVVNTSTRDRALYDLSFSFAQRPVCDPPDAGVETDAGVEPINVPAISRDLGGPVPGCGCTAVAPLSLLPALALLLALRRRR